MRLTLHEIGRLHSKRVTIKASHKAPRLETEIIKALWNCNRNTGGGECSGFCGSN